MPKYTFEQVNTIWDVTHQCFMQALMDEYPCVRATEQGSYISDVLDMKRTLQQLGLPIQSASIGLRYRQQLCALSTEHIIKIIEANDEAAEHHRPKRSPVTIDALATELFERAANSETNKGVE